MKLRHLDRLASLKHVKLIQLLLCVLIYIKEYIVVFDNAGADLDQRILTDERIYNGLKYLCGFRLCEVIISLKNFICL